MLEKYSYLSWLETVGVQIKFPPDRKAILAELADHMSDRRTAFMEQGMSALEASEAVAAIMGDPVEVGKSLNKIHRPVLGWIWQLSRGILVAAVVLAVIFALNYNRNSSFDWGGMLPEPDRDWELDGCFYDLAQYSDEELQSVAIRTGAVMQAGVYTLELDHGSWVKADSRQRLTLGFRVKSKNPLDLNPRGFAVRLRAEDDLGNLYDIREWNEVCCISSNVFAGWPDLDWRDPYLHLVFEAQDGIERQWIRFYVADTDFEITIDAEGRLIP